MGKKELSFPETNLKHYHKYIKRLNIFAKSIGLKIHYRDNLVSEGVYVPLTFRVYIENDLSESSEIAILLHELGHSLDLGLIDIEQNKVIENAYAAYEKPRCSVKNKRIVMKCERTAWKNARVIAHRLKIKLGIWFNDCESLCLKTYSEC